MGGGGQLISTETADSKDLQLGALKVLSDVHPSNVLAVAFSPHADQRDWMASASSDRSICITDFRTGSVIRRLDGHSAGVLSIAWHPVHK
jgi:WD40 repeat protein